MGNENTKLTRGDGHAYTLVQFMKAAQTLNTESVSCNLVESLMIPVSTACPSLNLC